MKTPEKPAEKPASKPTSKPESVVVAVDPDFDKKSQEDVDAKNYVLDLIERSSQGDVDEY